MQPVRIGTCCLATNARMNAPPRDIRAAVLETAEQWMQFGDELVYVSSEQGWPAMLRSATSAGVAMQARGSAPDRECLHVVIQKGRLFQQEHPDVPVLVDKGRFLLVDLSPQQARNYGAGDLPCYAVRPMEALDRSGAEGRSRLVFDTRRAGLELVARRAADPTVQGLVDRVSRTTFEADLAHLVGLTTRFSTSSDFTSACDFVEQQLSGLGYATARQAIAVNGQPSANVLATREGSGPAPRALILVTAHLDSVNIEGNATSPAPGADDDGSGSAGVLEIARALSQHQGVNDLQFVLFGGEEQGLFGSRQFVAAMPASERARVRAVVQMDMVGSLNSPSATVLLEGAALSQTTIEGLAEAAAVYTGLGVQTSLNPFNSDHVSFIDEGMPAVLTIEGADSANDAIHSSRDTIDRIDFDLAIDILRMNTAFVVEALA